MIIISYFVFKQSFQLIIMSKEQPSITQQLIDHRHHKQRPASIDYAKEAKLFVRLLFCFERNYEALLLQVDPEGTGKDVLFVNKIPGYRKYQLVFLYYLRRFGLPAGLLAALLFPLPLAALLLALAALLPLLPISGEAEIVLIGLRCSVLSYLCRYCLHFPEDRINWMIYLGSMACAVVSNNNATFIAIYGLVLCLSYFKSKDASTREERDREKEQYKAEYDKLAKLDMPKIKGGKVYVIALAIFLVCCWMAQRAYAHSGGQYGLVELLLVSLLGTNQELASFFPGLYRPLAFPLPTANIYALGYLLPGLHLKTFFLLVAGEGWAFVTLAYLAVHLPSLLLACVGLTQREAFLSLEWRKMSESVQAASNGLVLVAVGSMLAEEDCQLHIAFFTALVIFTVTKLYKFNEIISALLGVFLVASRAAVLHLNNKKPLSDFLCRQK